MKKVYGEQYLIDKVVPLCYSIGSLKSIARCISVSTSSSKLDSMLWEKYVAANDYEILRILIDRSYPTALEAFTSEARKEGHIPGKTEKNNEISDFTESIKSIRKIDMLDLLFELLRLASDTQFHDSEFGIGYACRQSIIGIANDLTSHQRVMEKIELQIESATPEYEHVLYPLRQEIRAYDSVRKMEKMSFRESKRRAQEWISVV